MPTAWRLVKRRHAEAAFDGEGARRYGGRWNSPGTAVAYASETRALAVLEVLAGIRSTGVLGAYLLVPLTFPDALAAPLPPGDLPADWRTHPPPASTRRIGDGWVARGESALLRVPSVLLPEEFNYLLNPAHPAAGQVEIGPPRELALDPRLLG